MKDNGDRAYAGGGGGGGGGGGLHPTPPPPPAYRLPPLWNDLWLLMKIFQHPKEVCFEVYLRCAVGTP